MLPFPYEIVVIGLLIVILAAFAAAFFFMRELRLRSMSPAHTQTDLTNMMILFQTMRDILSQQKDLAREFNISIDRKVGEVRKLIEASGNVRADLERAKREISALSTQTRNELASLERRLTQIDGRVATGADPALVEDEDLDAESVDAAFDEEAPSPEVEEASEALFATQEETPPLDVLPREVGAAEDEFLSKWAGVDDDADEEDEEFDDEEPDLDPMEAAEDAAQTRNAMRDLLDLHTESGSNGGGPSSTDVLNSGGNGGNYLTPIQKRVYEYSDAGMRVPEIARELGVGKGEIRLILSLRRDRSR